MPDITMCHGGDCPMKDSCLRYTARPGSWQVYFVDLPLERDKCSKFWKN